MIAVLCLHLYACIFMLAVLCLHYCVAITMLALLCLHHKAEFGVLASQGGIRCACCNHTSTLHLLNFLIV